MRYVKDMNLNTVRFEGKIEEAIPRAGRRDGILVMAGWCCCDHWEQWKTGTTRTRVIAEASMRDQIRLLRNHPCGVQLD